MSSEDNSDAMQVEKTDTMEKAEPIESAAAPAAGDEDLLSDPGSIDSEPEAAPAAAEDVTAGLSLEECISEASKHKAQGNTHFKAGEAADACQSYQMGIKYVSKHKEEESVRELFLSLHNNLAATLNQLELWDDAIISATNVLELDATNGKALFRRGVARFKSGQLDEARVDLTTVCRADPKNREARTVLASVSAAMQAQKEQQRNSMKNMFSGKKSLYHAEEVAARKAAIEAAKREREEEEALRREWQDECERLRKERAESAQAPMEMEAAAAAVEGGESEQQAATPETEAAPEDGEDGDKGGEKADSGGDNDEPISFEAFKAEKKKRAEEVRKLREEEEKARAEHEREERRKARAKSDVVVVDDEEDLGDAVRGYKKRADGTTTTYFDRQVDEKTKSMLDALKAPKRIDAAESAAAAPVAGSAWNKGGTWEEKDISAFVKSTISSKLGLTTASIPHDLEHMLQDGSLADNLSEAWMALPMRARVVEVKSVDGHATVASSRGSLRHMVDFSFELAWEVSADSAADAPEAAELKGKPIKGTLSYNDVTSPTSYEVKLTYKKTPSESARRRLSEATDALKKSVESSLEAVFALVKQKTL
mmetsp:Transcript_14208/g.30004  ORF Transcript_14208/g.30004 Transcript_14208/m.30004 type:complete len:598 (+) Transcript_14208:339-2132(+)